MNVGIRVRVKCCWGIQMKIFIGLRVNLNGALIYQVVVVASYRLL